jgi:hypothetical protein
VASVSSEVEAIQWRDWSCFQSAYAFSTTAIVLLSVTEGHLNVQNAGMAISKAEGVLRHSESLEMV